MTYQNISDTLAPSRVYPIETMRGIAVLCLVSYHVIGSTPNSGLALDYPHWPRLFADGLIDVRMPLFAFIAGFVYGIKPVSAGGYARFVRGKLRRLALPGVIAAGLFALAATLMGTGFARDLSESWKILVYPYAHFWFLQAILMIFVFVAGFEVLTRARHMPALFGGALLLYLFCPFVPGNPLSVNGAVYLLPFFLLGVLFERHKQVLQQETAWVIGLSLPLVMIAVTWNIWHYEQVGTLSLHRQDLQSLIMGLAICALAIQTLPHLPQLDILGPYAFTIYLYHVLATAGMREGLHALGVTATAPVFVAALMAGIIGPVLLHMGAQRLSVGRRYILGTRT